MGLLDFVTGGSNKAAQRALDEALNEYRKITNPTIKDLTLPELQKYVMEGKITPEQAKAVLIQGNAYNDINVDPSTMMSAQDALAKLKGESDAGGMTDEMKARLTQALDEVATSTRGTNEAIAEKFAAKGIPRSLMAEAAMREESGNAARNANLTATQAAGEAEQNAINAMIAQGNLASQLHGQTYSEEANKAAAENAIRNWNAGAATNANEANAGRAERATMYNTQTGQNIGNANVQQANQRTAYNANLPQQVYENALQKASVMGSLFGQKANAYQQEGQQNAGLVSGLIGTGAMLAAGGMGGGAGAAAAGGASRAPMYEDQFATRNVQAPMFAEGGPVPGMPTVPGDSPINDKVHALLSPGEIVIPRSIAPNPEAVKRFVQSLAFQKKPATPHPDDVHTVLQALSKMRNGEIQDIPHGDSFMTVQKGERQPPHLLDMSQKPNSKLIIGSTRG